MRDALGTVEHDDGPGGVRQGGQIFDGVDGAEDVGHVADGYQLGAIAYQLAGVVQNSLRFVVRDLHCLALLAPLSGGVSVWPACTKRQTGT